MGDSSEDEDEMLLPKWSYVVALINRFGDSHGFDSLQKVYCCPSWVYAQRQAYRETCAIGVALRVEPTTLLDIEFVSITQHEPSPS